MISGYTYRGVHKETQQVYIGSRTANIRLKRTPEEDFGKYYFTSSKKVKELGFENFNWCITSFVFEKEQASVIEEEMILDQWSISKELSLNHYCSGKFNSTGKIVSEKTREKISKANKGRNHSEETREKISKKGKGKIISKETREKISNREISNITREKISKANKGNKNMLGKNHSEEAKAKISKATSGENNGFYGKKHSEEAKKKISLARRKKAAKHLLN